MASRIVSRGTTSILARSVPSRSFSVSGRLADAAAAPLPARKPVGAFRGGFFGFLLGSTLAGSAVYFYVLQEYKVSNQLLTEDIYALQNQVFSVADKLASVENKLALLEKKKKQ